MHKKINMQKQAHTNEYACSCEIGQQKYVFSYTLQADRLTLKIGPLSVYIQTKKYQRVAGEESEKDRIKSG